MLTRLASEDVAHLEIPDDARAAYYSGTYGASNARLQISVALQLERYGLRARVSAYPFYSRAEQRAFIEERDDDMAAAIGRRTHSTFPAYLSRFATALEQSLRTPISTPTPHAFADCRPWEVTISYDPTLTLDASLLVRQRPQNLLPLARYVRELLPLLPDEEEACFTTERRPRTSR